MEQPAMTSSSMMETTSTTKQKGEQLSFHHHLECSTTSTTTTTATIGDAVVVHPVEEVVVLRRPPAHPPSSLQLTTSAAAAAERDDDKQPQLMVQSPKTPTLSRKLKAISLDSEPRAGCGGPPRMRDVFSMPNTPKKHTRASGGGEAFTIAPPPTNLKRFASNSSISGSQTLKTLPEIMMLQDFTSEHHNNHHHHQQQQQRSEPVVRIKAKGLLERRGSNASLTIDLGGGGEKTPQPPAVATSSLRLNSAKSISTLNLTSFGTCFTAFYQNVYKCEHCLQRAGKPKPTKDTCGTCTIYESVPSKFAPGCSSTSTTTGSKQQCSCVCNMMGGRKSLSNENLYVPPCGLCSNTLPTTTGVSGSGSRTACMLRHCRGHRRACYPRQADLEESRVLSDDFKLHLQNVQYLQTAGSVLSIAELRACCEQPRVPKLHQEFWEVPLNLQEKCIVSGSQTRNRYKGVLPNEHSRVILTGAQPYIHANYVKGPDYTETAYIATQGPMAHTCDDFWQMVWQTNCESIVMLTQLVEKGRNKCELYFPLGRTHSTTNPLIRTTSTSSSTSSSSTSSCGGTSSSLTSVSSSSLGEGKAVSYYTIRSTTTVTTHDKFTFGGQTTTTSSTSVDNTEELQFEEVDEVRHGDFRIAFGGLHALGDVNVRTLSVTHIPTAVSRVVRHYWYARWQDHKMAEPEQVLRLAVSILESVEATTGARADNCNGLTRTSSDEEEAAAAAGKTPTPVIVHCSAGIGRTGCFLAILNGIRQLRSNANVDVLAILCSLRLHRGGMVQTAEQYELIHRVLGMYAAQITHGAAVAT